MVQVENHNGYAESKDNDDCSIPAKAEAVDSSINELSKAKMNTVTTTPLKASPSDKDYLKDVTSNKSSPTCVVTDLSQMNRSDYQYKINNIVLCNDDDKAASVINLRHSLERKRNSLSFCETHFIEELLAKEEDVSQDDLASACHALNDDSLFFDHGPTATTESSCVSASAGIERANPWIRITKSMGDASKTTTAKRSEKRNEMEDDYSVKTCETADHEGIGVESVFTAATPPLSASFSQTANGDIDKAASCPKKDRRDAHLRHRRERYQLTHANLWKAHERGISTTPSQFVSIHPASKSNLRRVKSMQSAAAAASAMNFHTSTKRASIKSNVNKCNSAAFRSFNTDNGASDVFFSNVSNTDNFASKSTLTQSFLSDEGTSFNDSQLDNLDTKENFSVGFAFDIDEDEVVDVEEGISKEHGLDDVGEKDEEDGIVALHPLNDVAVSSENETKKKKHRRMKTDDTPLVSNAECANQLDMNAIFPDSAGGISGDVFDPIETSRSTDYDDNELESFPSPIITSSTIQPMKLLDRELSTSVQIGLGSNCAAVAMGVLKMNCSSKDDVASDNSLPRDRFFQSIPLKEKTLSTLSSGIVAGDSHLNPISASPTADVGCNMSGMGKLHNIPQLRMNRESTISTISDGSYCNDDFEEFNSDKTSTISQKVKEQMSLLDNESLEDMYLVDKTNRLSLQQQQQQQEDSSISQKGRFQNAYRSSPYQISMLSTQSSGLLHADTNAESTMPSVVKPPLTLPNKTILSRSTSTSSASSQKRTRRSILSSLQRRASMGSTISASSSMLPPVSALASATARRRLSMMKHHKVQQTKQQHGQQLLPSGNHRRRSMFQHIEKPRTVTANTATPPPPPTIVQQNENQVIHQPLPQPPLSPHVVVSHVEKLGEEGFEIEENDMQEQPSQHQVGRGNIPIDGDTKECPKLNIKAMRNTNPLISSSSIITSTYDISNSTQCSFHTTNTTDTQMAEELMSDDSVYDYLPQDKFCASTATNHLRMILDTNKQDKDDGFCFYRRIQKANSFDEGSTVNGSLIRRNSLVNLAALDTTATPITNNTVNKPLAAAIAEATTNDNNDGNYSISTSVALQGLCQSSPQQTACMMMDNEVSNEFLTLARGAPMSIGGFLRNAISFDEDDLRSLGSDDEILGDMDDFDNWCQDGARNNNTDDGEIEDDERFDAWRVLRDEYALGYGGGGTLPFLILGTSAEDIDSQPHVLSPPLMETLQNFLPISLSEQNFWLKYSLVRDGDTLHTLLRHARGSKNTLLAVETTGGEVLGSYTSEPWRKTWGYYGTGESFLWRLRQSRETSCSDDSSSSSGESSSHVKNRGGTISVLEQAKMESEVDVYPWTGENEMIQVCTTDRIAVGGGSLNVTDSNPNKKSKHDVMNNVGDDDNTAVEKGASGDGGFGFALEADLLHGTSSPCATFGNPCLSRLHDNSGGVFEIVNVEVWTLTPCTTLEMAQKMEMSRLFLEENRVS